MSLKEILGIQALIRSYHFVQVVLLLKSRFGLRIFLLQPLYEVLLHLDAFDCVVVFVVLNSGLLGVGILFLLESQNLILELRRLAVVAGELVLQLAVLLVQSTQLVPGVPLVLVGVLDTLVEQIPLAHLRVDVLLVVIDHLLAEIELVVDSLVLSKLGAVPGLDVSLFGLHFQAGLRGLVSQSILLL